MPIIHRRRWWPWLVVLVAIAAATVLHYGFGWEFCDGRRCPHRYKTWSRAQVVHAAGLRHTSDDLPGHYRFHGCRVPVVLGTRSDVSAYRKQGATVASNPDHTAGFEIEAAAAAGRRCKSEGDAALKGLR